MQYYHWSIISDPFLPQTYFVVSPYTGHLLSFSDPSAIHNSIIMRAIGGFKHCRFSSSLSFPENEPFNFTTCGNEDNTLHLRLRAIIIRRTVRTLLKVLPLGVLVYLIIVIVSIRINNVDQARAVSYVANAFGIRSVGNCLEVSICRFWMFRLLGWSATLNIGVLFPTEEMHAWVSLNHVPVLENADFIGHYQVAIAYSDPNNANYGIR